YPRAPGLGVRSDVDQRLTSGVISRGLAQKSLESEQRKGPLCGGLSQALRVLVVSARPRICQGGGRRRKRRRPPSCLRSVEDRRLHLAERACARRGRAEVVLERRPTGLARVDLERHAAWVFRAVDPRQQKHGLVPCIREACTREGRVEAPRLVALREMAREGGDTVVADDVAGSVLA